MSSGAYGEERHILEETTKKDETKSYNQNAFKSHMNYMPWLIKITQSRIKSQSTLSKEKKNQDK